MIDVSQWRASIGLWNYCQAASSRPANGCHSHSFKAAVDSKYMKLYFIPPTGDVELNPGPMIDDRPDIFLLLQWLEPLVEWQQFGLLLPGITQQDITIIKDFEIDKEQSKEGLFCKWLKKSPTATWRDVLNALTKREEINLLQTINDQLQVHQCTEGNTDAPTSTVPVVSTVLSSISVINKPVTSTTSGTGEKELTMAAVTKIFTPYAHHYMLIGNGLNVYVSDLNPIPGTASTNLMIVFQRWFDADRNVNWATLTKLCYDFPDQLGKAKPDLLEHIGQSDVAKPITISIPDDVQGYADNMRQHYKHQPILASDWPPRIGKDYFGRLALVEKQDSSTQAESAWHQLRGQVDKTVKLTENKEISVEDVLQPTDSFLSLRVVIDGPPGIGKTTLCRKLLNMWSNGPLVHQQYDLVLYCPLRNSKIATATTLADLFVRQLNRYKNVPEWFEERDGEGLLIIFDGWDELSEKFRQSSLAASIICKEKLDQCSVIVTSRSYASSSLLKMDTLSRHVQVIGFSEEEISTVIIQTLQKDTKLAQELIDKKREDDKVIFTKPHFTTTQSSKDSQLAVKLINDLKVRNDVQSLCYVPLVCSMVILVYCKEGGHLPTTLTQLYENFILQTIRRHVKRHDLNPHTLGSISSLPSQLAKPFQEMCQLAYTNLANTRMTVSSHQLQSLSDAAKEEYLGLMTRFTEYDEEKYQFLHLSIQEFLAAWWIGKHEKKTEEVFKDHFDDDHFQMCLRFVAGLTHLEHESYQQYFNIQQLDLQCKRKPLFGLETCHLSYFCHNFKIGADHIRFHDFDSVPIFLFQILYESQNTTLCQVLAQSINNRSLCLDRVSLSLFDWLCLSYCINNSNTTWNHLHLGIVSNQSLSVFTAGLTNNSLQTQCKRLEVGFLPQLKILHLIMDRPTIPTVDDTYYTDKCTELEKCIEMNLTLQEMIIKYSGENEITSTIISVTRGVTRNKTLTSLTIQVAYIMFDTLPPLPDGVIEQLLKDNNTLQALSLNISDRFLPSSLNIVE
uniref:NACHT domain-containing protein n=1 Tax=Amphimedon queenslandica TaxID=400682 RepID=A0A1X7TD23_AMPQE